MIAKKCVLSNGLYILNTKRKINDLVLVALTDFNDVGKFVFDLSEKKILRAPEELKLNDADLGLIQEYFVQSEKTPEVKV